MTGSYEEMGHQKLPSEEIEAKRTTRIKKKETAHSVTFSEHTAEETTAAPYKRSPERYK